MSSESQFSYNGPLSTYKEWHSAGLGAIVGIGIGWSATLRHDLRNEPHYAVAGLLGGALGAFILQQVGD